MSMLIIKRKKNVLFPMWLLLSFLWFMFPSVFAVDIEVSYSSSSVEVFGLPSIIYGGIDDTSGNHIITQVSSKEQLNKYLCFRVGCLEFRVMLRGIGATEENVNLTTYGSQGNVYCINIENDIGSTSFVLNVYCGNVLYFSIDYALAENTNFDLYFESEDVIKIYEEPSNTYANTVYYLSTLPGKNITLKLYGKNPSTGSPLYIPEGIEPISVITVKETYSLADLRDSAYVRYKSLCEDRSCFIYSLKIPETGVLTKSMLMIPLIINVDPNQDSGASFSPSTYCRLEGTNNCLSKVLLLYPSIFRGNITVEGIQNEKGEYYYGQKIKVKVVDYKEYDIGDGGEIVDRYVGVYFDDRLLAKIPYNPMVDEYAVVELNKTMMGKNLTVKYVAEYKNKYDDIIFYNISSSLPVSEEFLYEIKAEYVLSNLRIVGSLDGDGGRNIDAYLPGSIFFLTLMLYVEDKLGNINRSYSFDVNIENITDYKHSIDNFEVMKNKFIKVEEPFYSFLIRIPSNISHTLINPYIIVNASTFIANTKVITHIIIPTNFTIFSSSTSVMPEEILKGENVSVILNLDDALNVKVKDVDIVQAILPPDDSTSSESIGISTLIPLNISYHTIIEGDVINTTIEVPIENNITHSLNCISILYDISNHDTLFERCINITYALPGIYFIVHGEANSKRVELENGDVWNITFENVYDVQKVKLEFIHLGNESLDMDNLEIVSGLEKENVEIVDRDGDNATFSNSEIMKIEGLLLRKYLTRESKFVMQYNNSTIFTLYFVPYDIVENSSVSLSVHKSLVVYDSEKNIANLNLIFSTDVSNLKTIGLKIKVHSDVCSPTTVFNDLSFYIISKPGTYEFPLRLKNKALGRCGEKINLTFLIYRVKYNYSFLMGILQTEVFVQEVRETPIGDKMREIENTIQDISFLCEHLENITEECNNIDVDKICKEDIVSIKREIKDIDLTLEEGRNKTVELYTTLMSIVGALRKCNYTLSYITTFRELREEFTSLFYKICHNKQNVKKIRSYLSTDKALYYDNMCNVYVRYLNSSMGDLDRYREAIDELKKFENYIYLPEKKPPYGKYLAIFLLLVVFIIITAYLITKFSPKKEEIKIEEEDLYAI